MNNNRKVKTEKVEQKKCKMPGCPTLLPYGDKHLFCENCRGKCADNIKNGVKITLGAIPIVLSFISAGKINKKK